MHPNPAFRKTPRETNLDFARERGFGTIAANGPEGPLAAHVPFILSDDGAVLDTHLVRSNPLARALPAPALVAVNGPDGYISPDWYGLGDQVPTWNYVAVHLRGTLELRPAEELRDLLDRQSAHFEALLHPKPAWTAGKMSDGLVEKMMRAIVPCRMHIDDVQGTWKLNQNKPGAARLSAAAHLEAWGTGPEARFLAALMRGAE